MKNQLAAIAMAVLAFAGSGDTRAQGHDALVPLPPFPVLERRVPASLPPGESVGYVVVRFVVAGSGEVTTTRSLAGPSALRAPAEAAVRQWRFSTGRRATTGLVSVGVGRPDTLPPQPLAPTSQTRPVAGKIRSGVVVLEADIHPDGKVAKAVPVSGPEQLRGIAQRALMNWTYPKTALAYRLIISVRVYAS